MYFEDGRRTFCSATGSTFSIGTPVKTSKSIKDSNAPRLLVRTDARFTNIENKIDILVQQVAEITLVLKKSLVGPSNQYRNSDRAC